MKNLKIYHGFNKKSLLDGKRKKLKISINTIKN